MKTKFLGLVLFLSGFLIFNSTFFIEKYRLSNAIVESSISDVEKQKIVLQIGEDFIGKEYSSSFQFVSDLNNLFDQVNEFQVNRFSVSDSDIEQIVQEAFPVYQVTMLEELYAGDSEEVSFKREALKGYSSWMDGREYGSKDQLRSDLSTVAQNITLYEVSSKKGFDKYELKNLRFELTRAASFGPVSRHPSLYLITSLILIIVGAILYFLPLKQAIGGIKNNGIFQNSMTNGGILGIALGTYLILFYILLYFAPEYMTSWVLLVDPVSYALKGSPAGQFFLYGFLYTIAILVMGVRMLWKYKHSRYQVLRTFSVMFFQLAFAFLIPEILLGLNQPYFDFKNIWPLDYDFFFDNELNNLIQSGGLGIFMLFWGVALIVIAVPVFTYFFGKRWYCSWVCGCGGLAETLGDPYRQLSDKSLKAWKIERYLIHGVLVFAVLMTTGVLYTFWTGQGSLLGVSTYKIREVYGVYIGAGFAGVVGTGFYPFMGNRVWCRFGCPLAAYLGMVQRFKSRFRITTNGGQCISCGNCSTYCEMGIDVRWYAQRGQNIVRSSCVGCGVCSSVCPRGVLNLEVDKEEGRFGNPILIGRKAVSIVE